MSHDLASMLTTAAQSQRLSQCPILVESRVSHVGCPKLKIAFDSRKVRLICEDSDAAIAQHGASVAEMLKHRLADIDAADSVADLLVGSPTPLTGTDPPEMCVQLCDSVQLVFRANHLKNPESDGELEWPKVTRIRVLRIESADRA